MKKYRMKPRLEILEDRWAPAVFLQLDATGNLVAILANGSPDLDLTFTAQNTVNLDEGATDLGTYLAPGNLVVTMGNLAVPGTLDVDFGTFGMDGSLTLHTGNALGGYFVNVGNGTISGSLNVKTGSGGDTVFASLLGALITEGSITVDAGAGFDSVGFFPTTAIDGSLTIKNGNDVFSDVPFAVGGSMTIDSSREGLPDSIRMGVTVAGSAVVSTGAGADLVRFNEGSVISGSAAFRLGAGDDSVQMGTGIGPLGAADVLGHMTVIAGSGNDDIQFGGGVGNGSTVGGNMTVIGESGNDTLRFSAGAVVTGRAITYIGGNGNDELEVNDLTAVGARLTFLGGNGADTVDWNVIPALFSAYLDGGTGANVLDITGVVTFPITIRNFP